MTRTPKPPPSEWKPVAWGWVALTAVIAVVLSLGSVFNAISRDQLNRLPADATAREQGQFFGFIFGLGLGAALIAWIVLALIGRLNRRKIGWRTFLLFVALATAANFTLVAFIESASNRPPV